MERVATEAGLAIGRPVVVLIGGAAKLDDTVADLRALIRDGVIATAQAEGATVVDGGTDSGVMAHGRPGPAELGATRAARWRRPHRQGRRARLERGARARRRSSQTTPTSCSRRATSGAPNRRG